MRRPPLSAPGHGMPRQGLPRADIVVRLGMLAFLVVVTGTTMWTLWLAGQLGGVLTHGAWPGSTPAAAPAIALRLAGHRTPPADAWPLRSRSDQPPPWVLSPIWTLLLAPHLSSL